MVAAAIARHGALDIVVNNAGFHWDGVSPYSEPEP